MNKVGLLLFVFGLCVSVVSAQVVTRATDTSKDAHPVLIQQKPAAPKPISKELSGGIKINTDGWSIFADLGKVKAKDKRHADMFYNVRYWEAEFTEKKDPHEYKISGYGGGNNSFIYGKINNFYAIKLGKGFTRLIAGKPDPGSVSIHWIAVGGITIGFLKPYYLHMSDGEEIKYAGNESTFLDQGSIQGSAGFSKGLSEVQIIPGGQVKTGLHFDFSGNHKMLLALETGVTFEYYSQQIQMMANQPGTPYFGELYLSAQIGKRW